METEFIKIGGATCRDDRLVRISEDCWLLVFGYEPPRQEGEAGYHWRRYYHRHRPTAEELRADAAELINSIADGRILSGMRTEDGATVWLSVENQLNLLAPAAELPLRLKIGEYPDGRAAYRTFETAEELDGWRAEVAAHIRAVRQWAWQEKDGTDWEALAAAE